MLTAFFVMLREGFEAALVVAILYAYLRKLSREDLVPAMWQGVLAAAALSVGAGTAIHVAVDGLEGAARLLSFAVVSAVAVVVLTWMIFWMRTHARAIKGELQGALDEAMARPGRIRWAVTAAAFVAVLREGLEAALFMIASATTQDGGRVLAGALAGLLVACGLGWAVVLGGRRMPIRLFFQVTGVVLVLFAGGLLARTVMFLQAAGDLPIVRDAVYDATSVRWLTVDSEVGRFLAAMVGWDPRPSIEQMGAYLLYVVVVGWLFLRKPRPANPAGPGDAPVSAVRPT
ncbi:MAG TPA: FTR1 family protein [Actinomycetes bacterium]|nr:FTR1 family protein [Actinomycetes bacterium]